MKITPPTLTVVARPTMIAMLVGVVCAAVGLLYFSPSHSDESKKTAQADAPMVLTQGNSQFVPVDSPLRKRLLVAPVGSSSAEHPLELPAVVEADPAATVNVLPPLTGRLVALKVSLGDAVRAGQLLAVINSGDLAQAYADADKAGDALDLAKRAQERANGVNAAGANATKDLEQINSNYHQALAEANRSQQRLNALGVHNDNKSKDGKSRLLNIYSPVSGTVTALNGGIGAYLNDPNAVLLTVANLDHVWITANVPENLVATVHPGQRAEVSLTAYPGVSWQGKVSSVAAVLDADTHRNKARISFSNTDGRLKPNMYAQVKLATTQSAKLIIPTAALLMNNDSITVFVESAPWTFVRRTVTIGSEDGDQVSVISGLAKGERIITRGGVLIND